jgi:hypothetical protein
MFRPIVFGSNDLPSHLSGLEIWRKQAKERLKQKAMDELKQEALFKENNRKPTPEEIKKWDAEDKAAFYKKFGRPMYHGKMVQLNVEQDELKRKIEMHPLGGWPWWHSRVKKIDKLIEELK